MSQSSPGTFNPQQARPGGSGSNTLQTAPSSSGTATQPAGTSGTTGGATSGAAAPGSSQGLHPAQRDQNQQEQEADRQAEQQKENQPNPQLGSGGTPGSDSSFAGSGGTSKAGGSVLSLSDAEKEKIRRVIRSYSIAPPERAKFPLRLGATVPSDVKLLPLPPEVASIVPDHRNFSYVVASGQIAIVITEKREIDLLIPS